MIDIALAVPIGVEERLREALEHHGHRLVCAAASADELAVALTQRRCDVAVVGAGSRYLTARLLADTDDAGVRVVALIDGDEQRRYAGSLGLHEVVSIDSEWPEIEQVIVGVVKPQEQPRARQGTVVAVWGPAGAPGRTSVAVSVAAEIAAAGHTVALADVDTFSASVAPTLGLLDESPGFAAACRLAGAGSLSRLELERVGQRYLSGHGSFWVLTGIGRASRWPELSAERVTGTIRECRSWVDFTVLDTGSSLENDEEISSDLFAPRRNAATISALREADHVIAVGAADPVGMSRFLRAHVDLLETIDADRVSVVINKVRQGVVGLNPTAQIGQTLRRFGGITSPLLVPHDQAAFDRAVLTGRTLRDTAMRSPARHALTRFVRSEILPTTTTEEAGSTSHRAPTAGFRGLVARRREAAAG